MGLFLRMAFRQLLKNPTRAFWSTACIVLSMAMSLSILSLYLVLGSVLGIAMKETAHVDVLSGLQQIDATLGIMLLFSYVFITAFSVPVLFAVFRTGAVERIRHLDILKSTGSSALQLRRAVMAEAAVLSIPGLALGVVLALLFVHFALHYLQGFLQPFVHATGINLAVSPVLYWEAALLSMVILAAIITLSSWLAARQSIKMVEARIFSSANVSLFSMRSISSFEAVVKKFFGIEGVLAYRNLVRKAPDFPVILLSFALSVVLMIGVSSLETQVQNFSDMIAADIDAMDSNIMLGFYTSLDKVDAITIPPHVAEGMMDVFHEFPQTSVLGIGRGAQQYFVEVCTDMFTEVGRMRNPGLFDCDDSKTIPVNLIAIDAAHYAQLAALAGVPEGANILINYCRLRMGLHCDLQQGSYECLMAGCERDGFWHEFSAFCFEPGMFTLRCAEENGSTEPLELFVEGELQGCDVPIEIKLFMAMLNTFSSDYPGTHMTILLPTIESSFVTYFVQVEDEKGFVDFAVDAAQDNEKFKAVGAVMVVANLDYAHAALRGAQEVISFSFMGLAGFFILFGLAAMISINYVSVKVQSRDIAAAISVGMDAKSLRAVVNLGIVACAVLSLALGAPLGIAISWFAFTAVPDNLSFAYDFPWLSLLISVVGVSAMTWTVIFFSSRKLAKTNPLGTIRQLQN